MEIIKETKYLFFKEEQIVGKKTKTVHVINKHSQDEIASIEWYGAWRQYCFMPESCTVWNPDCLNSVNEVIAYLMKQRKVDKP